MSGYIGNQTVLQSNEHRQEFTITAATQDTFATIGYTPHYISVYRNGVRLSEHEDFTATDGSSVTLNTPAVTGDLVSLEYRTEVVEILDQSVTVSKLDLQENSIPIAAVNVTANSVPISAVELQANSIPVSMVDMSGYQMPSALRIKEIRDLEDNVMMSNGALTSNVSFPAGHVIQLKHEMYSGGDISTSSQNFVEINSSLRLSFALNSTNKVLVNISGGGPNKHSGSTAGMAYYSWGLLNSDGSITNFSDSSQGLAFFGSEISSTAHPCSLSYSYVYTPADWSINDYSNPFTLTPIFRSSDGGVVRATEGGGGQNIQVYGMVFQQ